MSAVHATGKDPPDRLGQYGLLDWEDYLEALPQLSGNRYKSMYEVSVSSLPNLIRKKTQKKVAKENPFLKTFFACFGKFDSHKVHDRGIWSAGSNKVKLLKEKTKFDIREAKRLAAKNAQLKRELEKETLRKERLALRTEERALDKACAKIMRDSIRMEKYKKTPKYLQLQEAREVKRVAALAQKAARDAAKMERLSRQVSKKIDFHQLSVKDKRKKFIYLFKHNGHEEANLFASTYDYSYKTDPDFCKTDFFKTMYRNKSEEDKLVKRRTELELWHAKNNSSVVQQKIKQVRVARSDKNQITLAPVVNVIKFSPWAKVSETSSKIVKKLFGKSKAIKIETIKEIHPEIESKLIVKKPFKLINVLSSDESFNVKSNVETVCYSKILSHRVKSRKIKQKYIPKINLEGILEETIEEIVEDLSFNLTFGEIVCPVTEPKVEVKEKSIMEKFITTIPKVSKNFKDFKPIYIELKSKMYSKKSTVIKGIKKSIPYHLNLIKVMSEAKLRSSFSFDGRASIFAIRDAINYAEETEIWYEKPIISYPTIEDFVDVKPLELWNYLPKTGRDWKNDKTAPVTKTSGISYIREQALKNKKNVNNFESSPFKQGNQKKKLADYLFEAKVFFNNNEVSNVRFGKYVVFDKQHSYKSLTLKEIEYEMTANAFPMILSTFNDSLELRAYLIFWFGRFYKQKSSSDSSLVNWILYEFNSDNADYGKRKKFHHMILRETLIDQRLKRNKTNSTDNYEKLRKEVKERDALFAKYAKQLEAERNPQVGWDCEGKPIFKDTLFPEVKSKSVNTYETTLYCKVSLSMFEGIDSEIDANEGEILYEPSIVEKIVKNRCETLEYGTSTGGMPEPHPGPEDHKSLSQESKLLLKRISKQQKKIAKGKQSQVITINQIFIDQVEAEVKRMEQLLLLSKAGKFDIVDTRELDLISKYIVLNDLITWDINPKDIELLSSVKGAKHIHSIVDRFTNLLNLINSNKSTYKIHISISNIEEELFEEDKIEKIEEETYFSNWNSDDIVTDLIDSSKKSNRNSSEFADVESNPGPQTIIPRILPEICNSIEFNQNELELLSVEPNRSLSIPFWKLMKENGINKVGNPVCGAASEMIAQVENNIEAVGWDVDSEYYELSRKLQRECKFKYLLRAYQTKEVTCISHVRYFDYNETDDFLYIDSQELWVDTIALGSNSDVVIIRLPVRTVFDFKPYGKMVTISMKQKEFCYNLFPITSKGNDMVNNIISNIEQFHKNEFNLGNIYHNLYENRDNRFQIQTGLTDDVSKMISYFMKEVKPQVETSEVYSWFKSFVTCVFGKYVSIGKQFFNQFAAEWEEDEFTAYCLTNDFSKTKQAIVVKCNGITGYGFCYNGGFFTPYHINKGKPMSIGGKRMSPNSVSRTLDLVSFGKLAKLETIKEGAPVWVSRNSETVEGRVLTSNPLRVLFLDAVPVAGMSGLPMYNENFQPVGIYATHSIINDGKDFLSGPYLATDWTRKPLEALRTNDKVTVAVPCSRGKSTFLVKNCLIDYRCIVCLEPRIPLVQGLSEYVGGTGFSEKDEIDIQPGVNFITHGKFVFSAISNFTQNFKDVNLFIIDECHDPSPFMMWSRRFLMSIEGIKVLEATATPNNAKFLMEARNAMKYDVDINEVAPRVRESFDEKQVIELVNQYMKGKNFIIQVAAGSIGEKLIQQIKGRKGLCVTRTKFQEGLTVEAINEHLKEEGAYICATNVLNYGITLNVDAIIVMGDKYETTYTKENVSTIQKVPISQSEMNQWIGRVGRLKTGIAIIPEMINRKIQPELSMDDLITLELLDKLAGTSFFGNKFSSQIEHLSIPQIRSALQVPGAILNAISYVDINGNLIGKCEESLKLAKELGVSVIEEKVQKKLYLPSSANLKKEMLGPVTGLDINFPKEWHDAVFSDTVECGAGSFLFNSLIGCVAFQGFTSLLQELMPGCTESFEDCSGDGLFKEAPKLKTVNSTDFDMPLIVARMQNFLEADDIIETGLSDFLTSIWNWIRKYIINGCPSVSHRNVTVHCYEEDATMAQSAAYFLGGGGTFSKELNLFDDGSGEPFIFSDKQGIWKGVNFTEKGFEILNQVKTGSPFSIYSLFPYFTAIAYKLLPASVFIGLVITYIKLKYSSENKETDIGVMLNKLGSDISKDKLMKSPLGEKILCNAVIPSSFSLLLLGKPVMFVTNLLERLTSNIIKYLDENEGLDLSLGNFKLPIKSHSHLFKKINKQVKATNNFSQGFMVTTGMMEISTILLNICKLISGGIAIDAASNPHNMLIHAAVIALGTTGYFLGVTPLTYFGAGSCLGLGFSIVYDKIKEYYEWARIKLDNRVSCNLPLVSMIIGGISIPYGLEFLTGCNYLLLPCSMFLGWKLLTSLTQHYILGSCIVILSYFFKELYEHITRREIPIPEVTYLVTNELVEPSIQVLIPYAIDEESYGAYDDLVEIDNETLNLFKVVSFTELPTSQVITFIFKEVQYVYNYFNKKLYIFKQIPLDTDIVLDYQLVGINTMHYMTVENKLKDLFETFYVSKTVTRNGMLGIDLPDDISVFSLFSKENPNKNELKSIGALISVSLLKPMRAVMMKKGVPIGVFGNFIQETIIINFDKVFFMNFFRSAEVTLDVEEFQNNGVVITQRQNLAQYIGDIEDADQTTSVINFGSIFMVASLTQFLGRFPSRYYNAVTYVTCVAGLFFDCLFNMGIPSLTGIITGQLVKSTISSYLDPVVLDNWKWDINNPLFDQFKPKVEPKPEEPKDDDDPDDDYSKVPLVGIYYRFKDSQKIIFPEISETYLLTDNYKLVETMEFEYRLIAKDKSISIDTTQNYRIGTNLLTFMFQDKTYVYSLIINKLWIKTISSIQDNHFINVPFNNQVFTLTRFKSSVYSQFCSNLEILNISYNRLLFINGTITNDSLVVKNKPTLIVWTEPGKHFVSLCYLNDIGMFPPESSLSVSTDVEDITTTSAIGTSISLIILVILRFLKRQEPRVLEQSEGAEWSSRNVIHNMTNFTAKTMLFSSLSNFISTKFAIISAGFMLYPLVGSIFNLINMRNKEKSGIDHIQFGSDLLENKAKPVIRSCENTSYVLGVAGDEVWYYRAALFIKNRKFDFPVQVVISDKDMEKAEIFKQFLEVTVIPVTIDHPSEIRCARLLPIFFGNPNELFLLRDADYIESELEMFSIQLSLRGKERVSSNSLRAGGPILAGVSNIYGLNNQPELAELFEDNKGNWKKYGFDELFLLGLDNWDICVPNLSPSEQVIQWASARNTKGLNINIHSFHVRVNLNTMETKYPTDKLLVKSYKTADMTSMSNYLNFHMSQAQYFSICDYISKITCSQEVIDRYETHEDSKDRASTSFPLVQSFSLGMMVAMDSMVKSLYMFLLKHGYTEQLDQVKNNAVLFCGYILGNFSAVRQLKSAIKEGNLLCKEDNLVAKVGQNLLNQRRIAGTSDFKPKVAKPLQNVINLCSWIFNPVGSAAGLLMNYAFDIDKSIEMTMVGALMSTSNPCLVIAGIMKFIETETKSANETTNVVINVFTLLSGQVTTGKVEVLWTSPHIKKLCEFEIPWLNENITQYQKNFRRGKVPATIKYQSRTHSLVRPIGMISFRASMMYFLCRHNLINFRDGNILILGSGKGGLIQGLLAGGISNKEITAVTLPESGWTTLPEVEYHASVNKVKLTTILADAFEADIESAEIVINDMMFQTDDELIQRTKFNILRDFHDTQAKGWRLACMLTKFGGTCIQSVHGHPIHRILQCVVECSLWFKEIRVMFEPANESILKAWVICKRKRRLNYLPTVLQDPSDYRLDDEMNCIVYDQIKVNAIMKEILLYAENKEAGKEWCAYLNSNFKVPIITATNTVPYVVSNEPWGYLPSGLEEEIEWFKKARYKYYSKVPITQLMNVSNLPLSERFNILGYTERAPVQASIFNTGQDLLIARTLRINDLEDEILDFRVPDQSPFGQVLGLYKRYDFPLFENVCNEMIEAYDYLQGYVVEQAKGFDFSEYTQADLYEQVNTKSSLGYMSEVKEYTTKLKDLVLNHWNLIELERDRLLKSGVNNLTFHSATKIEKKLYKGESIQVPRIFMFRRGEVRCAEMLLTGRLNFFFGSSKKFFASSTGTIHNRYQTLGEAWENYKKPTALAIESMKWDGHVGIKVQVMARKIMIYAAEAGENGQNVADVIHSTCFHDCCGQAYLSNGYLVRLTGNVKSGLWCTSCGNKIVNTMIALASIKRTFPKLTFSEIREKFFLKIEGDDGIILGEYNDIEAILSNLPQVYEECGFPQDETYPVTRPALTSFCSHGFAKEQTTGKWLPMRNMREIFGRMVVPVSNNAFTLDLVMCARSLSVVISAVATFFHLRPVRDLFRILQAVIPKGVVPASCLPTERWKHLRDFGEDFKMLDFKLNTFASEILGQEVDVDLLRMNSSDLDDIEYFVFDKFNVENTIFLLKEEIETICSPTEFDKEAVWFSKDMTTQDVIKDLPWMLENGINDIVVETSYQLRDLYLHTDIPRTFKLSWMSAVTTMRKRTNKVHFYCHSDDIDRVKLSLDGSKNYNMNRGFKAESLYYERVVTSAPIILGICGSILALGFLAYKFLFKKRVLKFTGQVTMMKFEEDEIPIEGKPYKLLCKEYKGIKSPRSQTLGLARTEGSKCLPAVALINNQILTVVSVEGKSVRAEFVFPKISNVHPDKREQLRNAIRESRQLDNIMPELGWCKQSGIYRVTATPGVGDLSRFKMHVANMAPYLPEGCYSFVMNSGDADLNDSILNSFGKNTIPCSNDYENLELSKMKPSFDKLVSNKNNNTKIIRRINQVVFRGKPSGTTYCSRLKFRIELQNNPIEDLDFAFSSDQSWYEDDKNGNIVRKSTFGWIDKMSESDLLNYKALLLLPGYSGIGHIMKWMSHGMPIVVNHYDMPTGRLQEWFKTDFPELSCETIDECREIIKRIVKLDQSEWQKVSDKILMFHQIYAERIKRSTFTLCQQGIISENPPVTEVIPTVRNNIGRKVEYRDLYEPSYNHGTVYKPSSGIFMSEMKQDHGCGVAIYPLCEPDPNFDVELLTMEKNYKLSEISQKYGIPFNITNNMFNPHNEEYSFDKGNHFIEIVECNKIHYVLVHYGQGGNLFKLLTKLNLKVDISPFESDAVNILQYCQDIAKLMRKFVASCVLKVNFLEFELMYNDWSHDYLHVDEQEITQGLYKDNIIPLMGGKEGDCLTMLINDQEFAAHGLATGKNKFPLNIKVSAKLVKRLRSNCVKDWLELL